MKKVVLLLLLALLLCFAAAQADSAEILGKPFPDFTATDTEGNAFTLSEALKEHEAVLINLWATWCPPCRGEFPDLQAAYEALGDRVAFIALSVEPTDTMEKLEDDVLQAVMARAVRTAATQASPLLSLLFSESFMFFSSLIIL